MASAASSSYFNLNFLACCSARSDKVVPEEEPVPADLAAAPSPVVRREPSARVVAAPQVADHDRELVAETVRLAEALLPGGKMSQWQRDWCTPLEVGRYLRGRQGRPAAAAEILAQALVWRQEYQEVLSGAREPKWQVDLRVLTASDGGNAIIYGCLRHNVRATPENLRHIVEHFAAVLEASHLESLRNGVVEADTILDCYGFRLTDALNPKPLLALLRMANQPYRDCLRTAMLIDAPRAVQAIWRSAAPLLSDKTRNKIQFLSREEAVRFIAKQSGARAARDVDRVMRQNRTPEGCYQHTFPSEIRHEQAVLERSTSLSRTVSHLLTRAATAIRLEKQDRPCPWSVLCCRRRRGAAGKSV